MLKSVHQLTFFLLLLSLISSSICVIKKWEGTLVFSDEFEGDALRKYYWDYDEGCGGRGPRDTNLECFKKGTNNVQIENGTLIITAKVERSKEYNLGSYKRELMRYSSGKISQSGFGVLYGTFVVRARLPKGKHLFPSIYLLPMGQRHESCKYEEIDLILARGQRPSTIIVGAQHGRNYKNVAIKNLEKVFRNKDFSSDFHEFAVQWLPTKIQWYVDGQKIYETTTHFRSDWTNSLEENVPCTEDRSVFAQRSALVIGLRIGGQDAFPIAKYGKLTEEEAKEWPKPTMEIDWVKVYDTNAEEKQKITVFNIPGINNEHEHHFHENIYI